MLHNTKAKWNSHCNLKVLPDVLAWYVKAVDQELTFIVKALIILADEKYRKTTISIESKCLLISMCNFNFAFGLLVLKTILSNTAS